MTLEQIEKIVYKKDKKGKDILFLQYLADKNGIRLAVMTERIQEMLKQGGIFSEKYARGLELHIEQSGVIDMHDKDLGIVTGGIG